jgi:hypothetical protein
MNVTPAVLVFAVCVAAHGIMSSCRGSASHIDPASFIADAAEQAERASIDYRKLVRDSFAGNRKALAELLGLSAGDIFDGAGSLAHSRIVALSLQEWGDRSFARVFETLPQQVRNQNARRLKSVLGHGWETQYPITASLTSTARR